MLQCIVCGTFPDIRGFINKNYYYLNLLHQRRNLEAKWRHNKQADVIERTRKQQRQLRDEQLLRQSTGLRGILRNNRPPLTPPPLGDAPLKDGVKELGGTKSKASQNWSDKMYYFIIISHLWDCDIDTLILSMPRPLLTVFIENYSPSPHQMAWCCPLYSFRSTHFYIPPFTSWVCFLC